MTDQPPVELASLLATLLQQQTAMLEQQSTLLQVHGESVRLQRLLMERVLGNAATSDVAKWAPPVDLSMAPSTAVVSDTPPPTKRSTPPATTTTANYPPASAVTQSDTSSRTPVADGVARPPTPAVPDTVASTLSVPDAAARGVAPGGEHAGNAAYATRYYRAQPSGSAGKKTVLPQDLELLRRLREMRDSSGLILQFGRHMRETLGQVAISDPDYIRELVFRAQRPEVRAAACRLVEALDAAAEHKPRPSRSSSRRSRASA